MQISLSPRIYKAMERYCIVANKVMCDAGFRPLDYVIAQRVLPLINNSKKEHLEGLKEILSELDVSKSVSIEIVEQIIKRGGEDNIDIYDYFSIVGY